MRRLLLTASLLILACGCRAANVTAVKRALDARYAATTRAFQTNNIKAWSDMLTPDYVAVQPDRQTLTRKQVLRDFASRMASIRSLKAVTTIEKLTVRGNVAVAMVRGHWNYTTLDTHKQTHKMQFDDLSHDTWVHIGDAWKLKRSAKTEVRVILDGHPLDIAGGYR